MYLNNYEEYLLIIVGDIIDSIIYYLIFGN